MILPENFLKKMLDISTRRDYNINVRAVVAE